MISKKKLAAAEWFERANYSREQANQAPSLSVSCALATIVVELIAFHMQQYHLVHQSVRDHGGFWCGSGLMNGTGVGGE